MFQSTTKGILHFEDLSPQQFEDLYRNILLTTNEYRDIRPYGIKGCDDGVDILCTEKATGLKFFIQCKRHKSLCLTDLKKIVNRIIEGKNDYQGHAISVVAACDISREAREAMNHTHQAKDLPKHSSLGNENWMTYYTLQNLTELRNAFGVCF